MRVFHCKTLFINIQVAFDTFYTPSPIYVSSMFMLNNHIKVHAYMISVLCSCKDIVNDYKYIYMYAYI